MKAAYPTHEATTLTHIRVPQKAENFEQAQTNRSRLQCKPHHHPGHKMIMLHITIERGALWGLWQASRGGAQQSPLVLKQGQTFCSKN